MVQPSNQFNACGCTTTRQLDINFTKIYIKDNVEDQFEKIEGMVNEVMEELALVHSGVYYEPDRARKIAALALQVQILMAKFLASKEADGKAAKLDIEGVEAEEYFAAIPKDQKKPSDALLEMAVIKSTSVREARIKHIKAEQEFRQWYFLQSAMKEAHIYFRSIGNSKEQF